MTTSKIPTRCPNCDHRFIAAEVASAAVYNTDALARIKNGATARELGWDENFYTSVCRKHGLEQIRAPKTQTTPEIETTAPLAPSNPEPLDDGEIIFETTTRLLRRGALTLTLAMRQSDLVVLITKSNHQHPATGRYLAERMHLDVHGGIGGHIIALRKKLAPLGIKIGAQVGRGGGGYFFADQTTGEPLIIKVAR